MPRQASIVLALLLLATPSAVAADELSGYGRVSAGLVTGGGELGTPMPVLSGLGLGLRVGRLDLGVAGQVRFFSPDDRAVHSHSVVETSLGPELRYAAVVRGPVEYYFAGGLARAWLSGSGTVQRTCGQTRDCTAGFYRETPSYAGTAGRFGVGVQRLVTDEGLLMRLFAQVDGELLAFDVFGHTETQLGITLRLGCTYGVGRLR